MKKAFLLQLILFCIIIFLVSNCKKSSDTTTNPPPPNSDTISLNDNVVVIDSTTLILNNDSILLNKGEYNFSYSGTAPDIKANDVIIGSTNGGYIRKVSTVTNQPNKIVLETTQGNMEDVFRKANFNFDINTENLAGFKSGNNNTTGNQTQKQSFDFNDIVVYQNGPLIIKLKQANVTVDGDWNFGYNFENSHLDTFEMTCRNASFNAQSEWNVNATQAITLAETESSLKTVSKYFIKVIPIDGIPVPVVVKMQVDFICKFSASVNAALQRNLTVNSTNSLDIGLEYKNSQWQTIYNKSSNSSIVVGDRTGNVNSQINLGIIPRITFVFYQVAGPYASLGLKELIKGEVASPALDWDFYAGAWLQSVIGAKAEILGKTIADFNHEWNTDTFYYQTPDRIQKVSGDNQTGSSNQYLAQPLKVRIVDNVGASQSNVPVYFTVTNGGGSVENKSTLSDANGYATTRWKLGNQNVIQIVEATAKKGDGSLIADAPIEFAASTSTNQNLIQNGDFSLGNIDFITDYTYCNSSNCLYPLANNGYAVANDASSRHDLFVGKDHTDGNGQFMIVNGAISNYKVWSETVSVTENTDYGFTFWLCTLISSNTAELIVKINGIQIGNRILAPSAVSQWIESTRNWNSGSSKTATIEIFDTHDISSGNDFGLDDLSFK